ncbi:MAG TPA: hypothetical protein VHY20_11370 [Pirellulales bacterium]|nr:hypothetical protein [Pirellulales bacterium]
MSESIYLDRQLYGDADSSPRQAWRPHYSNTQLPDGHRIVKTFVRCRCGAKLIVVPCLACGCDPTKKAKVGS